MISPWRALIRSYPCETCDAGPGDPCRTPIGNVTAEHMARVNLIARCPKCGTRLHAETEPGELCPRCALLRDLNTERATHHKRER